MYECVIKKIKAGWSIHVGDDIADKLSCIHALENICGFNIGFNLRSCISSGRISRFQYVFVVDEFSGIGNYQIHMGANPYRMYDTIDFGAFMNVIAQAEQSKLQPADFTDLYDWF